MKQVKFYQTLPEMECLRGDTLRAFKIRTSQEDPTGSTMKMIIEMQGSPGAVVKEKECQLDGTVFRVQITSEDTSELEGIYRIHFCLTDTNGLKYRKLAGTLNVKPTSQR